MPVLSNGGQPSVICMYVPNRIKKKLLKTDGKSWLWNLYIKTARWTVMISDSFITFKSLKPQKPQSRAPLRYKLVWAAI